MKTCNVEAWRYRARETGCRRTSVEVESSRALESRCRRVDIEVLVWRDGVLEVWMRAVRMATWRVRVKSSGGAAHNVKPFVKEFEYA